MNKRLTTSSGPLLVEERGGILRARGVPYATAKRFAPPKPVPPWVGAVDATRRGPACPQLPSRLGWVTGPVVDDLAVAEDCLVLSVTAPADAEGLPVMVWFHGGAYVSGSGESPKYDPEPLAVEGLVVVVNVSYRLGIFGYLTPEQAGDADNLGLRDQILALRWVRDNIAGFGGNPGRVTAFGQSAGGDSVLSLMLCEEADGLFHRAILQSAPLALRDGREAMTVAMRRAASDALDVDPRDTEVERLLDVQTAAAAATGRFGVLGGLPFAPVLSHPPLPSAARVPDRVAKVASRVELLIGHTRDDAAPFVAMHPRAATLQRLGPLGRAATHLVSAALTRRVFAGPARALARTWRAHGGAAATYRFDWAPETGPLGACHCIELPFLLGSPGAWADAPMLGGRPVDSRLARRMRRCWTDFAHGGVDTLESRTLRFG